jgi:hypothetical protein
MKKTKQADSAPKKKFVLERETLRHQVIAGQLPSGTNCPTTRTYEISFDD